MPFIKKFDHNADFGYSKNEISVHFRHMLSTYNKENLGVKIFTHYLFIFNKISLENFEQNRDLFKIQVFRFNFFSINAKSFCFP